MPLWQANAFSKHLVVRTTADPRAVVVAVQRELRAVDPTAAIENVKTLEQIRDESLAVIFSRVLRSFLFEVQPGDPVTFIVVGALFVGVGLLACWAPVRRAGKVDPLEALR